MPQIGAAYLRCSDPRQDKSIDQQRDEITRRAQADGVIIPPENWFIDEGLSGRSAKKRKSYQDLLQRAETQRDARKNRSRPGFQPIDRLYVWAFSRIARNMFDCLRALATLDEADIDVISLTEPDAGDRSFRKLIRPILAWLAERYSEELSRNVVRGMRSQAERGFWQTGHAPYGYTLQKVDGGSRLAVTDDTRPDFETVQRIFREYLEGKDGQKRLAERLTLEGVRPPSRVVPRERFAGTWRPKHIQLILMNPAYCGHIAHNGEILARNAHEAAVTDEQFAQVAALRRLKDRSKEEGGNANHPIHMSERGVLTPWLRCGTCGGRVAITSGGQTGIPRHYYTCASRQENKSNCTGMTARVDRLDEAVLTYIHDDVLSPTNIDTLIAEASAALTAQPDELQHERARLADEIAQLDQRIRKIGLQVAADILSEEDARAINAPLRAQREHLKLRLASLPERRALPTPEQVDPARFRAAVLEAWTNRPLQDRREALDQLVERITLSTGGAHIDYRVKHGQIALHQPDPSGPPKSPHSRNRAHLAVPVYRVEGRMGPPPVSSPPVARGRHGTAGRPGLVQRAHRGSSD